MKIVDFVKDYFPCCSTTEGKLGLVAPNGFPGEAVVISLGYARSGIKFLAEALFRTTIKKFVCIFPLRKVHCVSEKCLECAAYNNPQHNFFVDVFTRLHEKVF